MIINAIQREFNLPRDSVPYKQDGLFSSTVVKRSKYRTKLMFMGMGIHTAELQEDIARYSRGINVYITPMDFKAPKADIVFFIINQCRRYFRNILLTRQLTNQLVINPAKVNTVRSL